MADVRFHTSEVVMTQPKLGVHVDLDMVKRVLSLKPKPEVDFQVYGRHLETSI